MTNKLLFFLFISLFIGNTHAQSYRTAYLNPNSNYFDIVAAERAKLEPLRGLTDRKSKKQIKQFERWASFWKDRILEDGSFVTAGFKNKEFQKDYKNQQKLSKKGLITVNNWTLIGPLTPPQSSIGFYPGMGRLNTVAFNGTNVDTLYVGSPAGGIWKSTDAGVSWTAMGDDLPNMGISHIVIDPNNTNTLYIANGDADGGQNRSLGVYKSTNGGNTWNITGLSFGLSAGNTVSKLLIDPNNSNIIFATTLNSIKRSTDGGATWADAFTDNAALFNDIVYKIGSNSIIYATSRKGKFYISTNNGISWSIASTPSSNRLDIALTANDVNQILTMDNNGVLRKSTNQGSTWTTVSNTPVYTQGGYNLSIAVSPLNKDLVIIGGIDGYRSINGGISWEKYLDGYWQPGFPYFYVHSDHHDMLFIPNSNIAFSVNDGGIFKGDASANTPWADLSSGLAITQYYNVSGTPQNANFLIAGAQDNDVARYDGVNFIGENPGSDGVNGLWDYSNSDIAWTCSQQGGLKRTTNGFVSSQDVNTPGGPFIWELEIHPTNPLTIFGGFDDIYKSINRGNNWTSLNSGIGYVEFISIAPSNPNIIYVSGDNGIKKTINGGTSWSNISLPQSGNVKSIEVHPTNPDEVYLAYSGYSAGKVYKSTNGGSSFTNITGSLPNIPTHKIIYKTGSTDGELFLATDLGVYYRTNSVGDWVKLNVDLPNVIVLDIVIHYGTEKIRAATYGRGVWERSVTANSLGIENSSLADNVVDLYPNPSANNKFTIKLNNLDGNTEIIIYNLIGSVVKQFRTRNSSENIDLTTYAKGVYLVKIINNRKSITKKIILE